VERIGKKKKRRVVFVFGNDGVLFFLFDFCLFVDDDEKGKSFVEKFVCVFGEFFLDFSCV